jgi:hypothetical protein
MKRLRSVVLAAAVAGLALAASAGATTRSAAKVRHVQGRIEALALDGNRIAYDVGSNGAAGNKVLVWNERTGKTTKVSGSKTRGVDDSSTGSGVIELAIAGTRVAWLANVGGNSEGDDYLFTSSVVKSKERRIASVMRTGDSCAGRSQINCAGDWLGGLVGSGGFIALNRWTTDGTGSITAGELDLLVGTKLKQVATGPDTVEAASVDGGRIAVLRPDGTVGLYSTSSAQPRLAVSPANAEAVALSGRNLVVLTAGHKLEVLDAKTSVLVLRKTFSVHGTNPSNLDVQGNIAIYTTGSSVHAVNLTSGKDRVAAKLHAAVAHARIDSAGLAYAGTRTLGFLSFKRVAAAVAG